MMPETTGTACPLGLLSLHTTDASQSQLVLARQGKCGHLLQAENHLQHAAVHGRAAAVEELIKQRAAHICCWGRTPLHTTADASAVLAQNVVICCRPNAAALCCTAWQSSSSRGADQARSSP